MLQKIRFPEIKVHKTFDIGLDVYKEFGVEIIMVPKGLIVAQRCEFILGYAV